MLSWKTVLSMMTSQHVCGFQTHHLVVCRVADEYKLCCMWEQGAALVLLEIDIGEAAEWAELLDCPLSLVKQLM